MADSQIENNQLTLTFLLLLGCYFALHIALRVFVSDSLDYDEAEQALLAQWLLAGYTEQPPLYTWIQYLLFQLFGKNVFAVSLLKNSLLFFTYVFVFFGSREILKDSRIAVLATLSLLLIPQIAWESQRDMTHTTLVVFAAAATLWQTLYLVRKQNLINYCTLGLFLSIGILAKANFALFVTIMLLTLLSFQEGRRLIFSRKITATLLIIAAATSIYFLWMFNNQDIVFSATHKFKQAADNYHVKGTVSLFTNSFLFVTPLWLLYLLVFPAGYGWNQNDEISYQSHFIRRYLLLFLLTLLLVVLFFKVTYVKERWLQPLLFCAPIFFFSRLDATRITKRRFKTFISIASVAAIAVYIAFTVRVVGASYIGRFCRLNYPFSAMTNDIRAAGFLNGLIISDNRFLAGNMHLQFPDSTALVPNYKFETLVSDSAYSTAAVIWKADHAPAMPGKLNKYLQKTYRINPAKYPVDYFEHRYKYGRTETVKLAVMQFPIRDR